MLNIDTTINYYQICIINLSVMMPFKLKLLVGIPPYVVRLLFFFYVESLKNNSSSTFLSQHLFLTDPKQCSFCHHCGCLLWCQHKFLAPLLLFTVTFNVLKTSYGSGENNKTGKCVCLLPHLCVYFPDLKHSMNVWVVTEKGQLLDVVI